jgi:hypothetical protein
MDERANDPGDPAAELVGQAGRVLGWLYRGGWEVARRLPGWEAVERQARRVERAVVDEVRKRLDEDGPTELQRVITAGESPREPLRAAMAELLERSVTDSREASREYYFALVMRQLLPDEARIVAALSDGAVFPLAHLAARTGLSGPTRYLLENASTVGRAAGVVQPGLVPFYVTRLIQFGLAEVGEEVAGLSTQYELLLTDERVRALEGGRLGPRVVRLSLHISELGAQFWAASDPSARGVGR